MLGGGGGVGNGLPGYVLATVMLGGTGGVGNGLPGYVLATAMLGGGGGVGNGLPGYVLAMAKAEQVTNMVIRAIERTFVFITKFSCLELIQTA
jgi:hypothetical protein